MSTPLASAALRSRQGFTLIELLTVILIIGILASVLVLNLRDATETAEMESTRHRLAELKGAIDNYYNEQGGYPPSSFSSEQEVSNDGENVGIEALVVALWSRKFEAGGLLGSVRDELTNVDGDSSPKRLTDFETRELLEVADAWDNPIAYIERADYPQANRRYLTIDRETGEDVHTAPVAFKNPRTGQYYQPQSFQLISAGSDGRFGTEDDITTFDRE
jgi:prepilin-type N-terminal cleavage/methylation domain-containing protein